MSEVEVELAKVLTTGVGGKELFGAAPRGQLEREAQKLLNQVGGKGKGKGKKST